MGDLGAFLLHLRYFQQDAITLDRLQRVRSRSIKHPAVFHPEEVGPVSQVAAVLCAWVNSVCARAGPLYSSALEITRLSESSSRIGAKVNELRHEIQQRATSLSP